MRHYLPDTTQSKKVYYEHRFNAAKNDIRQTLRIINIITKNRKVENIVKKIIQDDIVHEVHDDIVQNV